MICGGDGAGIASDYTATVVSCVPVLADRTWWRVGRFDGSAPTEPIRGIRTAVAMWPGDSNPRGVALRFSAYCSYRDVVIRCGLR